MENATKNILKTIIIVGVWAGSLIASVVLNDSDYMYYAVAATILVLVLFP